MLKKESNRSVALALALASMPSTVIAAEFYSPLPRLSSFGQQQDPAATFNQYGESTREFLKELRNRLSSMATVEQIAVGRNLNLLQLPITALPPAAGAINRELMLSNPRRPNLTRYIINSTTLPQDDLNGVLNNELSTSVLSNELKLLVAAKIAQVDVQLTEYRITEPVVKEWHGKFQANYFIKRDGTLHDIKAAFSPVNKDAEIAMWRGANPHPNALSVDGKDIFHEWKGRLRISAAICATINGERKQIGTLKFDSPEDTPIYRSIERFEVTYRRAPVCDEIPGIPQGGDLRVNLTPRGRKEVIERHGPLSDHSITKLNEPPNPAKILENLLNSARRSFEPASPAHTLVQEAAVKIARESFPVVNPQSLAAIEAEIADPKTSLGAAAAKLNRSADAAHAEALVLAFRSAVTPEKLKADLGVGESDALIPSVDDLMPRLRKSAQTGAEATWLVEYGADVQKRVDQLKAKAVESHK